MKLVIDIPEILLDRIKSAKCVPDMYGSDIVNTVICVRDATPYKERPNGEWILVKPYTFACSLCGRLEEHQEPFCNCGAKMEIRVGEAK